MSSGIGMQPNDWCKLRDYIRRTVTKSLRTIREHNPHIRFGKKFAHRKYFIDTTVESVKSAFNRYLTDPTSNLANIDDCDSTPNTECDLMHKHTDTIITETILFLQNVSTVRHGEFETIFLHESKKWIEYAYDIFANEMRWVDGNKNAPTKAPTSVPTKAPKNAPTNAPPKAPTTAPTNVTQNVANISTEKRTEGSAEKNKQTAPPAQQSQRKERVAVAVAAKITHINTEKTSSKRTKAVPVSASKEQNNKRVDLDLKERSKNAQKHSNDGNQTATVSNQTPQRSVILIEPIAKKRCINKSQDHTSQKSQTVHSNRHPTHSRKNASTSNATPLANQSSCTKPSMVVQKDPTNKNDGPSCTAVVPNSIAPRVEPTQTALTINARSGHFLYHCYYCKDANKANATFDNEKSVFSHWQMQHEKEPSKPFRFHVEETAMCYHCDFFGLWTELVKHYFQTHYPTMPFAISNGNDRSQCAFCEYTGQMPEHIETKHKETLHNLSSKSLSSRNGFMQISAKNVEKLFPNGVHERTQKMQFICDNNHPPTSLARGNVVKHLQEHGIECSCQFKTKSLFDFLVHKRDVHGRKEFEHFRNDFEPWFKNEYHNMMALFENGLVLPNGNLNGTHFRHFYDFKCDIDDFMKTLKLEFEQKTASKNARKITNDRSNQTASQTQESDRDHSASAAVATKRMHINENEAGPKRAKIVPEKAQKDHDGENVDSKEPTKEAQKHQVMIESNRTPQRPVILTNIELVPKRQIQSNQKMLPTKSNATRFAEHSSTAKKLLVVQEGTTDQNYGPNRNVDVTNSITSQVAITQTVLTNKTRSGELVYHCYYCKDANQSNAIFDNEESVFSHWQMQHEKEPSKPFQFHAEETASCYHCDFFGLWPELTKHHYRTHYPRLPLAITNGNDRTKCAFCEYTGQNMLEHIYKDHTEMFRSPIREILETRNGFIQISKSNSDKLFSHNHKAVRFICDTNHTPIVLTQDDVLRHLEEHEIKCFCPYTTTKFIDLLIHKRHVHGHFGIEKDQFDLQRRLNNMFCNLEVLFENGLVLSNRNLAWTNFKIFQNFEHVRNFQRSVKKYMDQRKNDFDKEILATYCFAIVICYVPDEDPMMIFKSYCRKIGFQISGKQIVKIERNESKRAIVVECRNAYLRQQIIRFAANKFIRASELMNQSLFRKMPSGSNACVHLEY